METRKPTPSIAEGPKDSPGFAARRIPLWFVIAVAVVFLCTQVYVSTYSGSFRADVYDENRKGPPPISRLPPPPGIRVYSTYCAGCHQSNGLGFPGLNPPLAGSEWVTASGTDRLIRIVLDSPGGPISVKGTVYNSVMIPWRGTLGDDEVAGVLTYIRNQWGNRAAPVTAEQVKRVRAETLDHVGPWPEAELLAIPERN